MTTELIIFDLDGTLVDAYKAIEKSLNFTLRRLSYPRTNPYKVRRSVGWGDENFIRTFVKDEDVKRGLQIYRRHHKASLLKHSRVIPKAKRTLEILKRRNYKLAVASNRPPRFSNILIRHLDLKKYFDLVICAKDKNEIKPKPDLLHRIIRKLNIDPAASLYVGDMTIDVDAGKNAGIKTIAVLGGSSSRAELKRAKPFKIISKITELKFIK
ncbi:MAG: hypothetical protein AMJ78_06335 [Omnitrophica WOR_2 bacterium SM23_29]|nr:MAG: hypothetical protein AMJ78_06335 [Omnitrophica WOR_2 bacterium SM23_29]